MPESETAVEGVGVASAPTARRQLREEADVPAAEDDLLDEKRPEQAARRLPRIWLRLDPSRLLARLSGREDLDVAAAHVDREHLHRTPSGACHPPSRRVAQAGPQLPGSYISKGFSTRSTGSMIRHAASMTPFRPKVLDGFLAHEVIDPKHRDSGNTS